MDPSNVRWSASEYTLQDYVTTFYDCFPNIIKITEGFLGKQEIDSVSSSTVIRVNSVYSQKRVIAESRIGKLFSLPYKLESVKFVSSPLPTSTIRGFRLQSSKTLEEILDKNKLPITVYSAKRLAVKEKGNERSQNELVSELTLQDTYEETFLLGHPIDKGKILVEEPIMIPMYMTELKLVVAIGFKDRNEAKWKVVCERMTEEIDRRGSTTQATFQEIFLLDKKDVSQQEPEYNCIEPIYIDIREMQTNYEVHLPNIGKMAVQVQQTKKETVNKPNFPPLKPPKEKTERKTSIEPPKPHIEPPKPHIEPPKPYIQPPKPHIEPPKPYIKPPKPHTEPPKPHTEPPKSQTEQMTALSTLASVPKDLHHLNVNQVCECLDLLNMSQYVKAFQAAQVDGQLFHVLDQDMMISCLGMNKLNALKLLKFRDGWRPNIEEGSSSFLL